MRTRPYERGAATPCISCQRGLSTVEFHEGRLAEARTAVGAPSHQAWLRLGCVTLAGRKRTTRQTAVPGLCSPAQLPRLQRAYTREDKSETEERVRTPPRRKARQVTRDRPSQSHHTVTDFPSHWDARACVRRCTRRGEYTNASGKGDPRNQISPKTALRRRWRTPRTAVLFAAAFLLTSPFSPHQIAARAYIL